jgi:pro-sigmaK processing inhibitor BofA
MEKFATLLIPALLTLMGIRLLLIPIRRVWRLALHSTGGVLCLGLINAASGVTGVAIPVNAVTVLAAGFGGLPAMGIMALLEML